MQRNNLFKSILIVFFLVLAIITLIPTFSVQPTQEKVDALTQEIGTLSDKPVDEVSSILCGDIQLGAKSTDETLSKEEQVVRLENDLRNRLKNQLGVADAETIEKALPIAKKLRDEYLKLIKDEAKAIKLGLDLQGGTYLVSEVNIPQLVYAVAKDQEEFRPIYEAALEEYEDSNRDFIAIVLEKLKNENIPAYRFFGETGDNDGQIRSDLNDETKDAVNRTLEVLRNRIDQFGVSEPNIQKQGDRRIVIELAGVKDITRAKRLIGTTAELRFQVVEGNKGVEDIMMKINRVLREDAGLDSALNITADAPADTATSTDASDETIQLSELFDNENDDTAADSASVTVDKNTYKEAPFTSLLRVFQGRGYNFIGVAPENKAAVEWILNLKEVQKLLTDVEFLWSMRTETIADEEWLQLYVVRRNVELTGKYITNAKIDLGAGGSAQQARAGEASVSMELNREGAKIFSQVTERIIDQHLAIILDNKVNSAPVVRVKIPNGRAQIDNIGSIDEAKDLALVLRAGALPAPMEFIEERTVGPSLGQDSINSGTKAALIGLAIVILFMVVYYSYFGIVADLALLLNIAFLMAVLSGFGLTLTLPGVAGIILTIGMAVDANVLIFERIREEFATGKTIRASIDNGYGRAFKTILDANVTTLLTALVLFQFGTGPVKGFAVTLFWGIIISMFTAIVVTRVIFDYLSRKQIITKIPY